MKAAKPAVKVFRRKRPSRRARFALWVINRWHYLRSYVR